MSVTDDAPRGAAPISAFAAKLALGAGVGFLVGFALAHLAKADLDPSWQPISMYAIGTHGWVMTLAFLLWGLSPIGLFVALRPGVRTWGGRVGLAFLFIGGSGPILAAFFPTDSISAETMTLTGRLHELGAVLGDGIPIATAVLTWSLLRNNPGWRPARLPLVLATVLTWVGVVTLTACLAVYLPRHGGRLGPEVPIGWPSRLMIVAQVAWLIIAAARAVKEAER
jgi:hypothetical protein